MDGLLSRALAAVLAVLAGALIGHAVGSWLEGGAIGSIVGAAVGAAVIAVVDALRGRRLLAWVRGGGVSPVPAGVGLWGEIGYRVQGQLRSRDRALDDERLRLQQFLSAIEASPNGVLLLGADEQIEWCNSVAADHFGVDPQRDRGQRLTHLMRTPAFVAHLHDGRFDQPLAFSPLGGQQTLSVLIRRYGDGMKLVLSQDVTERERHDAMRRDFVANVSHEMRTPLTVLAGFVETMASLPLTEVERRRVLTLMEQQTTRMQTLLTDLLTLATLEGSPRPPTDRWVAVTALLAQARADGEALSGERHRIVVSVPEAAEVAGSQSELLSAVGNLVTNAVRYTPDGGRIDIAWRRRADGSGEIAVSDTGVGIAREHLPRLTERFYRIDGSRSRETGGTGLGLSIVKHVVQRHGGSLDVASEPGKGSRFAIVLPAARLRAVVEASPAEAPTP
ncbi:MAG: phosphate regulon sensor histidine kinase PhoR [Burkholderiaceae bacterium]|nr:phosphate regulon sensor histidine kinase PhoR [Burkholderiaceae bacterium]